MYPVWGSYLAMTHRAASRDDEKTSARSLWESGDRLVDGLTDEVRSVVGWYPRDPLRTPTGAISTMEPGWELGFSSENLCLPPSRLDVKPKVKLSTAPPSIHCHVCGSAAFGGRVCGRYLQSMCRKVVCEKCLIRFRLEENSDISPWKCPHCLGSCPPKSKCHVYSRCYRKKRLAVKRRKTLGPESKKTKPDRGVKSTAKVECGK